MKKGADPVKEYVYEFVRYGYFLKDAGQSTSFADRTAGCPSRANTSWRNPPGEI